jgi:hypothetical protein
MNFNQTGAGRIYDKIKIFLRHSFQTFGRHCCYRNYDGDFISRLCRSARKRAPHEWAGSTPARSGLQRAFFSTSIDMTWLHFESSNMAFADENAKVI